MNKRILSAVKHQRESGNLGESVAIALGRLPAPETLLEDIAEDSPFEGNALALGDFETRFEDIREDGSPQKSQTQVWFCPDENAVNQMQLRLKDKMDLKGSVAKHKNGYVLTISGTYGDGAIASLVGGLGGIYPISGAHLPGSTK